MAIMDVELRTLRLSRLLRLYSELLQELVRRDVCRSTNNPVADIAELLIVEALGLDRAQKSAKGFDATDSRGKKYEIKSPHLAQPFAQTQRIS
jgi:hypothetical protein